MKNVLIFAAIITLKLFAGGGALYAQIPISNLPSTTNTVGAYIPVARNGYNYKIITDSLTNKKVDSLKVSGDTLYYYKNNGTRYFVGVIVGGSGSDTTSLSNRINLKVSIADTAAMLSPYLREVDTASLSSRINLKLNISDTASKTWDWTDITGKPVLILGGDTASMLSGYTRVQRFTDSLAAHTTRFNSVTSSLATKLNISDTSNMRPRLYAGSNVTITGTYPNLTIASTGGGSSDTSTFIVDTTYNRLAHAISTDSLRLKSARVQLNGSDITPTTTDSTISWNVQALVASDTVNLKPRLSAGSNITITGTYPNLTIASSGGGADSSVFATQYRLDTVKANRVRYVDTATMLTNYPTFSSFTSGRLALVNGSKTLYSSSKFNFSDALYPTMSIIGSDPLIYTGPSTTLTNNAAFGSGAGAAIYGGATYKSVQLVDQQSGGIQMARFYNSAGTIYNNLNGLVISNTLSSPSNYQGSFAVQRTVPYANNLNYHGFTDQTIFNAQSSSMNSFGSFVTVGNDRFTQGHYTPFQAVWYKDSSNTINDIYDFVSAVSEMREGTIDSLFRFKVFELTKTGGTINVQYGIHIPALTSATTNYGAYIEDNVGLGTASPTAKLDINSDKFRVRTSKTPSSATDTGNAGDICWDSNYIYICVSTNSWKRVAIATW